LSPLALVARPPSIPGVESWSIETRGHRGPVSVVGYNKDSKWLASGGSDGTVRLWEPRDGQLRRILLGHANKITTLAWSPDGKVLASGSDDSTVRLWQASMGKLLFVLAKHTGPIRALAWSPDGKTLASGSADKSVRLWDSATGESRRTFDVHKDEVVDVGWQSDKVLVSTSQRGGVRTMWVWEAGSGKTLHSHEVKGAVTSWSADRKLLAYKSGDNPVTLWDAATNRTRSLALKEHQGLGCLALSPDGKLLGSGGRKAVQLWDTASGELLSTGKESSVIWVHFSPDGKTLASGVVGGRWVSLWKIDSDRKADPVKPARSLVGIKAGIVGGGWSGDGRFVFAHTDGGTAQCWDAASGKALHTLPMNRGGHDVAWAPDGKRLAISTFWPHNRFWIWEASTGAFVRGIDTGEQSAGFVDWSGDGKLATSTIGYKVALWDVESAKPGQRLSGHTNTVVAAIFSPDSKKVASCGRYQSNKVIVFDVATGKGIDLPAIEVFDHTLGWSPDSQLLATGAGWYAGPEVKVWDASTGKPLPLNFTGLKNRINAVAWSPDGLILAAGDVLGNIALWNARTGAALKQLRAHDGAVHALAWRADSKTLLSLGEKDSTLCVWQTDTDKPPREVKGLPGKGRFSPDRRFLLSRFDPTRVQIWDTGTGQLQGTFIRLHGEPEQYLAIAADGHYRISGEGWRHIVHVVQTQSGQQILSPEDFEKQYPWKNDPAKVRLLSK
jgi:WD40 repeat protein